MDLPQEHIEKAQNDLIAAKTILTAEINDYPTPVAGCDVQFNYLLGERQKILNALAALDADVFVPTPRLPSEGV